VLRYYDLVANEASKSRTRIAYPAFMRLPTEHAHGVQVMRMCEALTGAGHETTLLYPKRAQNPHADKDPWLYYDVQTRFPLIEVKSPDLSWLVARLGPGRHLSNAALELDIAAFGITALRSVKRDRFDLVFTRDPEIALLSTLQRHTTVLELHSVPRSNVLRKLTSLVCKNDRIPLVVAITEGVKRALVEIGVEESRVMVVPDGVDMKHYERLPDRSEARRRLGIAEGGAVALYSGSLYRYKGVFTLVDAARAMPEVHVIIVGGEDKDVVALRSYADQRGADNVSIYGHVPPSDVPLLQAASDVLIAPNTAETRLSAEFTSPLKIFEYMAAGRPIVSTLLPSIQEVLEHERNALLVPPGDADALALAVRRIIANPALSDRLVATAKQEVPKYSWAQRVRVILDELGSRRVAV
jgi:glycosyltransferase involved in cell wall biosynthesis